MMKFFSYLCVKICKSKQSDDHAEILKQEIRNRSGELNKELKKMNRLLKKTVAEDIFKAIGGDK